MIATLTHTMRAPVFNGARRPGEVVRLTEALRLEATAETTALFGEVSGKRISAASVPGATRNSISRALNGCESNPLYRIAGWFVLARRLGIPKSRLQRVIDWLQAVLDSVYDDEPGGSLEEVLEAEQDLDAADDPHQLRAAYGDREALRRFLDAKRAQHAHDRVVLARVTAEVTVYG